MIEIEQIELNDIMIGDDTKLEFNFNDFNLCSELEESRKRYIKPKFFKLERKVNYKNAKELAKEIKLYPGEQIHYIVQGDFIFGDFIEALLVEKDVCCNEMYLSSLSLSQNNIDSLGALIDKKYIKNIVLMLSNYFYSHERNNLIPYLLETLDKDNKLDLLILRNHTKICLMQVSNIYLILSGSSNLRSSNCIEQFVLQESKELYDFYKKWFEDNKKYNIINKEA